MRSLGEFFVDHVLGHLSLTRSLVIHFLLLVFFLIILLLSPRNISLLAFTLILYLFFPLPLLLLGRFLIILPSIFLLFLLPLECLMPTTHMTFRLLIFLILLLYYVLLIDLKFLLSYLLSNWSSHLWHVEYLKHGIKVQMLQIQTL